LSFKFCMSFQLHTRGHLELKEKKKSTLLSELLHKSIFYHTTIKSGLHPIMLIQSINHHTFLCYTKPSIGVDNHSLHQLTGTALSKTANPIALAAAMMGGGYTKRWAQKSELSLLPPPLYICYKLFRTAKILYRACKLKPYKKKQLAVCQMSWIMWSLDYQIDALATIDAEAIIFQAQLERKNRWIDWQTFP